MAPASEMYPCSFWRSLKIGFSLVRSMSSLRSRLMFGSSSRMYSIVPGGRSWATPPGRM